MNKQKVITTLHFRAAHEKYGNRGCLKADIFNKNIGRNQICHCGSGLKHKKCCFNTVKVK